jgi:hypothetical protein
MMKSKKLVKEVFMISSLSNDCCPIVVCDGSLAESSLSLGSRVEETLSAFPLKNMQGGNLSMGFAG